MLLSFCLVLLGGALVPDKLDQSPTQALNQAAPKSVSEPEVLVEPPLRAEAADVLEQSAVPPEKASEPALRRDSNPTAESIGLEFVLIPAGEFQLGRKSGPDSVGPTRTNAADTVNDLDERPVTQVKISNDFHMARFEVTQGQWQAIMGDNPSLNVSCGPECPVESVSWWDVQEFLARLNEAEGVEDSYRLPTEAEWEYAARAGKSEDLYGALNSIAWHSDNSGGKTQPIGQKEPNAFGLHDMIGNTWEWVHDWKGTYPGGTVTDPTGPRTGQRRVVRGPGFTSWPKNCRVSSRLDFEPSWRYEALGFRVVRMAEWH